MKKFYTLFVALALTGLISAQAQIKFGIKAGVSFPGLETQNIGVNLETVLGGHAGFAFELKLPFLGIQADALYGQAGLNNIDGFAGDLDYTTLDIPVVLKLYILKVLNIQAGPQFTFVLSSNIGDNDIQDQMESNTVGFVAGLGVELGGFMASGRFIFPSTTTISGVGDYKTSSIQLSVGYWFVR